MQKSGIKSVLIKIKILLVIKSPVTVAVRSQAWVLAGWLLGSWVRIPLKAWMFVRVFLCCVVLCR
jgi:Na+-translocating ferredoxin:NAD+ oxidoreductase RnfD subunit